MKTRAQKSGAERFQEMAWRLDSVAVRLARGRPAIDVALGEIFLRMAEGGHIEELCFSKKTDFANEALGIPPRTFFSLCELAAGLRDRELLRQGVLSGEVTAAKARVVMDKAFGDHEGAWVAAAMEMTEKELRAAVGKPLVDGFGSMRTLRFRMSAEQQDRLDYALSLAKEIVGYDAPRWRLLEAVAREWLASDFASGPSVSGSNANSEGRASSRPPQQESRSSPKDPPWLSEMAKRSDEVSRQLRAVFEAGEVLRKSCCGVREDTALGLLAQAKSLLARRERFDEPLGRVLLRISREQLWRCLGFGSFGEYCRERLGISASTARQRTRLERKLVKLPPLRLALKTGRVTYSKALVISRDATLLDVEERIAEAESTTWQKVKERAVREERQAERERGEREDTGPRAGMDVVMEAVVSAKRQILALDAGQATDGEALQRMAEHFIAVHEVRLKRAEWRNAWQRGVLMRHGGLCAVPGCTRAARDIHHIIFRSKHGPDEPYNVLACCWFHHKRCIHKGLLTVRGRGGEYLVWRYRDATLTPWAEFETFGDDEVRVVDVGRGFTGWAAAMPLSVPVA